PLLKGVERLSALLSPPRSHKRRASAMDEQGSDVGVAALAHPAEAALFAGRVLSRRQADPARHVATGWEALQVADRGSQRARPEQADAGHSEPALDDLVLLCQ